MKHSHPSNHDWAFTLNFALFCLLLTTSSYTVASTIVTTIKPLFSLVSHLTEGVDEPVLLIKQIQSPHHYTMRPSDRRLLANAQMIIWVGPQMESYLSKVINQQSGSATLVSAMQAADLQLLNKRTAHSHQNHQHTNDKHTNNTDPHIWLSVDNTIAISNHIAQQLIAFNPAQAQRYSKNLNSLIDKIEQTRKIIATQLSSKLKSNANSFITYHDAFQYFEVENALNYAGTINFNDETGASLKHLREINSLIQQNHIQCLTYQAPEPALIKKLTDNHSIKAVELDPLGVNIKNSRNAWFELMQQLAIDLSYCLTPTGIIPTQ